MRTDYCGTDGTCGGEGAGCNTQATFSPGQAGIACDNASCKSIVTRFDQHRADHPLLTLQSHAQRPAEMSDSACQKTKSRSRQSTIPMTRPSLPLLRKPLPAAQSVDWAMLPMHTAITRSAAPISAEHSLVTLPRSTFELPSTTARVGGPQFFLAFLS